MNVNLLGYNYVMSDQYCWEQGSYDNNTQYFDINVSPEIKLLQL